MSGHGDRLGDHGPGASHGGAPPPGGRSARGSATTCWCWRAARSSTSTRRPPSGSTPRTWRPTWRTGPRLHLGAVPPVAPQSISLNLTSACNLACSYCYAGRGSFGGAQTGSMTAAIAEAAVDRLLAGCDRRARATIGFLGGEPFLRRDLLAHVVAYASRRAATLGQPLVFSVTTNGTQLHPADLELLRTHPFAVTVSLDGGRAGPRPAPPDAGRRGQLGRHDGRRPPAARRPRPGGGDGPGHAHRRRRRPGRPLRGPAGRGLRPDRLLAGAGRLTAPSTTTTWPRWLDRVDRARRAGPGRDPGRGRQRLRQLRGRPPPDRRRLVVALPLRRRRGLLLGGDRRRVVRLPPGHRRRALRPRRPRPVAARRPGSPAARSWSSTTWNGPSPAAAAGPATCAAAAATTRPTPAPRPPATPSGAGWSSASTPTARCPPTDPNGWWGAGAEPADPVRVPPTRRACDHAEPGSR